MEYCVLSLASPGRTEEPAGVLLFDAEQKRLDVKLRRDWQHLVDAEDAEALAGMEAHLKSMVRDMGASEALDFFEDHFSNLLLLGERAQVATQAFDFTLHQLYREHVPARVQPFVTHLPRIALRSAAGAFGEQIAEANRLQDQIEEWVEAPESLRLTRDMFVCEVHGRSMEPLVPSGSLCVFRHFKAGSRNGRRVLVEDRAESSRGGERYTLKVYQSVKTMGEEGWAHQSIDLLPLNSDFPVLHLSAEDEDRYAVVAEFVSVL